MKVFCVCGAEAPIVTITEDEPDAELKEFCLGKTMVVCKSCFTATQVTGKLEKTIRDAELIGADVFLGDKEREATG